MRTRRAATAKRITETRVGEANLERTEAVESPTEGEFKDFRGSLK